VHGAEKNQSSYQYFPGLQKRPARGDEKGLGDEGFKGKGCHSRIGKRDDGSKREKRYLSTSRSEGGKTWGWRRKKHPEAELRKGPPIIEREPE